MKHVQQHLVLTDVFLNKLLLWSHDTEGKVGLAFHMEQQVMRFREFITSGNFASVSNVQSCSLYHGSFHSVWCCGHRPCVWRLLKMKAGVLNLLSPD